MTCIVRPELVRNQAGHDVGDGRDSVSRLASTCVYKDETRQRVNTRNKPSKARSSVSRSLIIETQAIQSKVGVGFYLHREGPNLGNSHALCLVQPLQANLVAMAPHLSPFARASGRSKSTTVGALCGASARWF